MKKLQNPEIMSNDQLDEKYEPILFTVSTKVAEFIECDENNLNDWVIKKKTFEDPD